MRSNLIAQLQEYFPDIEFKSSTKFRWNPADRVISYRKGSEKSEWSLLHEAGHMSLGHKDARSDLPFLRWRQRLGSKLKSYRFCLILRLVMSTSTNA